MDKLRQVIFRIPMEAVVLSLNTFMGHPIVSNWNALLWLLPGNSVREGCHREYHGP